MKICSRVNICKKELNYKVLPCSHGEEHEEREWCKSGVCGVLKKRGDYQHVHCVDIEFMKRKEKLKKINEL